MRRSPTICYDNHDIDDGYVRACSTMILSSRSSPPISAPSARTSTARTPARELVREPDRVMVNDVIAATKANVAAAGAASVADVRRRADARRIFGRAGHRRARAQRFMHEPLPSPNSSPPPKPQKVVGDLFAARPRRVDGADFGAMNGDDPPRGDLLPG